MILAHQQTGQIPNQLLKEIFGNVSTMVSFVVSHADAVKISKEFITDINGEMIHIPPEEILRLKVGEAYCKIARTTFFMKTYLADQSPDVTRARLMMHRSRENHGRKPGLKARHTPPNDLSAGESQQGETTPKGAEMVACALGIPTEQLPFRRISDAAKDYYFLRHFLQVNDFRIALQFAQKRQASMSLLGFIPEYYGENSSKGGVDKYIKDVVCDIKNPKVEIQFTPDAVFALEKSGTPVLFFLEIDRGTEVVGNPEKGVLKAINFYYNYFISKKYNRYAQDFKCGPFNGFRVLFVTTTETRLGHMRAAVKQANHKETRFVWLTTADRIKPQTLFSKIWQAMDERDTNFYRIG